MDRGLESLRVRSDRNGNQQGENGMPIPFGACETERTIFAGAMLQNLARRRFCENERLGTR